MTKSFRNFPYRFFSEGRLQEKCAYVPPSIRVKLVYFNLKDVSRMNLSVISTIPPGGLGEAGAPPMCRPPSFLVVDTRVVAEHHRQGSTPVKLNVKKKKVT